MRQGAYPGKYKFITMQTLIQEIHTEFDTATERILAECNELINSNSDEAKAKADRLNKLGFTSSKGVSDARSLDNKINAAPELIATIKHFKQNYPFNKFITELEVKNICEKYGLLLGDTSNYIGDIPEKNLQEIENFKLKEEDFTEVEHVLGSWISGEIWSHYDRLMAAQWATLADMSANREVLGVVSSKSRRSGTQKSLNDYMYGIDPYSYDKPKEEPKRKAAAFKIVASKDDFDTSRMTIEDGYKLNHIPDPIVLQPVKGGYLIVSKWGLEANDESLINETMN